MERDVPNQDFQTQILIQELNACKSEILNLNTIIKMPEDEINELKSKFSNERVCQFSCSNCFLNI